MSAHDLAVEAGAPAPGVDVAARPGWERLVDAVLAPRRAFEGVAAAPTLFAPLLLACLLRFAETLTFYDPARTPAKLALTFALQGVPVVLALVSMTLGFWAGLALFGQGTSPGRVASVLAHTFFVYGIARYVLACAAGLLGVENAGELAFTHLGGRVDPANYPLRHFVSAFDALELAHLALIAYGLHFLATPRDAGRTATAVAAVWVAYLTLTTGLKVVVAG